MEFKVGARVVYERQVKGNTTYHVGRIVSIDPYDDFGLPYMVEFEKEQEFTNAINGTPNCLWMSDKFITLLGGE